MEIAGSNPFIKQSPDTIRANFWFLSVCLKFS